MVTIPLHHGYVTRAVDYRKRPNVLRWRGLDESISLFQAASPQEMDAWLAAMNYNAARFSAPVSLPVGSQTMAPTASVARNKTLAVRPLYPSKRSALSLVSSICVAKGGLATAEYKANPTYVHSLVLFTLFGLR